MDLDELYMRHIKPLSHAQQRRLLARLTRDLSRDSDTDDAAHPHSLLELEGLGAEIWQAVDAQAYIHALRDEWYILPATA